MTRTTVHSGAPWEAAYGYCRAVRIGDTIAVSGTTAPGDDARAQTLAALSVALDAVFQLGGEPSDVIRTRMYVTDIARDAEAVGRAHATVFGDSPPAATMVEVSRLIDDHLLVEIELDAVLEPET
ncbi:MAG: RidA family protein [Bacteroidota bacterium]